MSAEGSFAALKDLALEERPSLAVVLGSGMSPITSRMQIIGAVPFSQIPGLSAPSVPGHNGQMTLCHLCGNRILVFEGRIHFYEGHSWESVTRPIQVAHSLGARILLATNAAGGIHPRLHPGSFMAIRDHLDWTRSLSSLTPAPAEYSLPPRSQAPLGYAFPEAPLRERDVVARSPNRAAPVVARFPDRATDPSPYSPRLLDLLQQTAANLEIELFAGTYAAVTGPNYETPAEIRALWHCGADAVGMSTVREIQVAHDLGMKCAAISCITNRAAGLDDGAVISHEEVLQSAKASSRELTRLIEIFVQKITKQDNG